MTERNKHILSHFIAAGVLLASSVAVSSCSDRPKEILSEKEMVGLMADLQIAESYANLQIHGGDSGKERLELARSVLAAHGVSQEQLDTTLAWYGRNLDEYNELYAKVDKELNSRRKRLMKDAAETETVMEGDMLWPYGKNGMISSLGNSDGWVLSISGSDLAKGDRLKWSMHLIESSELSGVLGVEYTDGSGESVMSNIVNRNRIELMLQTDSGKNVKRVYGSVLAKKREMLPVFADSIMLQRLPYDSLEYSRSRSQRRYSAPARIEKIKTDDSQKNDSTSKADSIAAKAATVAAADAREESPALQAPPVRPGRRQGEGLKKQPVTDKGELKWQPRK